MDICWKFIALSQKEKQKSFFDQFLLCTECLPHRGILLYAVLIHCVSWSKYEQERNQIIVLAFLMADNGFDVYLGNARGNSYSLKHKTLGIESQKFWDFSWHEIGIYDLPAMIDFVLNRTRSENLFYFGHSQGTTSFFVLLSMKPEYNQKIIQGHLLTPSAFFSNYPNFFVHPLINVFPVWTIQLNAFFLIVQVSGNTKINEKRERLLRFIRGFGR